MMSIFRPFRPENLDEYQKPYAINCLNNLTFANVVCFLNYPTTSKLLVVIIRIPYANVSYLSATSSAV
jgi:hypothetical protein